MAISKTFCQWWCFRFHRQRCQGPRHTRKIVLRVDLSPPSSSLAMNLTPRRGRVESIYRITQNIHRYQAGATSSGPDFHRLNQGSHMTLGLYESLLLYCYWLSLVYFLPVFSSTLTLNYKQEKNRTRFGWGQNLLHVLLLIGSTFEQSTLQVA